MDAFEDELGANQAHWKADARVSSSADVIQVFNLLANIISSKENTLSKQVRFATKRIVLPGSEAVVKILWSNYVSGDDSIFDVSMVSYFFK